MNGETWDTCELGIVVQNVNATDLRIIDSHGNSRILHNIFYKNIKVIKEQK